MNPSAHTWEFSRAGGVEQLALRNGSDLTHLDQLDQKLWVALACPTRGLALNPKTLDYIDTDHDGRIRAPEILAVVKWLSEVLRNPDELFHGGDTLALAAINGETPAGAALLAGARRILSSLGRADAAVIQLVDVVDTERIFAQTRFNGDGIVPADAAAEEASRAVIADIIATQGSVLDRSGKPGVNRELVESFFSELAAFSTWQTAAELDSAILPLGEATAAAAAAVAAVRAKVDDYYTRCRLAAFDERAGELLNGAASDFLSLSHKDLTANDEEVARLPLARIEAGRALPLAAGVNPAWAAAIAELTRAAVLPLLGGEATMLREDDWTALKAQLAAYLVWQAAKPKTQVEALGLGRVRAILASPARDDILALIAQDAALEPEVAQITAVEKLLLYERDLLKLLNNFVNFSEFYRKTGAAFQVGTLYIDGRSSELCVRVDDAGRHAALAGLSQTYLAYCDCVRPGGEKLTIAAAITSGDSDNLRVGRNGIFYDRAGLDWDATITRIIDNPISIRQAFWTPYKKLVSLIEQQAAKRATAADSESLDKLHATATAAAKAEQGGSVEAKPADKKIDVGTVAAIGVAVGGIAAFFSSVLATIFGLGRWLPLGVLVLLLSISGPAMLIAWLKLRQRNLGPILDANGWAVNGRVKINVPFGSALTMMATLPRGSERSLSDPYAEERRPWRLYVVLLVLLLIGALWYLGKLDWAVPATLRSTTVLGSYAPAGRVSGSEKLR